jgi:hypothetical protein
MGSTGDGSCQSETGVKRFTVKEDSSASATANSEPASEKSDATRPIITSFRKKSRKGIPVRAPFF